MRDDDDLTTAHLSELKDNLSDGQYKGHEIAKNGGNFIVIKTKFLSAMIENLENR